MDMSGMGMDMGSEGMFAGENIGIALAYWFVIAAVVGALLIRRIARFIHINYGVRQTRRKPEAVPSKPQTWWQQIPATVQTVFREATYPQVLQFRGRISKHFSFLPTGRWLLLSAYWLMLLVMLWENAILTPDDPMFPYYWEKIGFRAAWVSVTQIPFIFCLSCKLNVISLLTGISYERLQWFHRWAGRTIFFTVIVHWAFFFQEWSLSEFVQTELKMMPIVYFGFGAWSVIGWMILTSISLFRDLCYELFVLQHLAAAGAFLWLVYSHVPGYATYNVWISIAFVAFDQIGRSFYTLWQNVHLTTSSSGKKSLAIGYKATLEALPDGYTRVCVADVAFRWSAGQHVYLSAPTVGVLEAHPFTIANDCDTESGSRELQLLLKAHGGFTKRLWRRANKQATSPQKPLQVFLSGPWGMPPDLRSRESLVFVSSATGSTFTVPMLQQLARRNHCLRSVQFWWIVRTAEQLQWFRAQIEEAALKLQERGVAIGVHFVVTCEDGAKCGMHPNSLPSSPGSSDVEKSGNCCGGDKLDANQASPESFSNEPKSCCAPAAEEAQPAVKGSCCSGTGDADTIIPPTPKSPTTIQTGCCCGAAGELSAPSGCCGCSDSLTAPAGLSDSEAAAAAAKLDADSSDSDTASSADTEAVAEKARRRYARLSDVRGCAPSCLCPLLQHADSAVPTVADGDSCVCLHAPRTRPALDSIIRPAVEEALGETGVVVCGGAGLVADVRNYVAALSDERAVHKGTGAQGIYLWAERYDW